MRDMQNLPAIRPAYILAPSLTCPIPLGSAGDWLDENDSLVKRRDASGADTVLGSSGLPTIAVDAVATSALATNTYNNGTAGVGASLTKTTNGALGTVDGVTLSVGNVVLVTAESTQANNGAYVVTSLGSGGTKWQLTRLAQFDDATSIKEGTRFAVKSGTAYAGTQWEYTAADAPTVGTTALTFALDKSAFVLPIAFRSLGAAAPATVITGHSGAAAITLTGAKVGDKVAALINLTDATDGSGSFEATISVANQIQQTSVSDLSAKKFALLVLAQS